MSYEGSNASYQALKLLGQFFTNDAAMIQELWDVFSGVLRNSNEILRYRDDGWEQDWFLAKFGADSPIGAAGWYDPPANFHSFPTFDVAVHTLYLLDRAGVTINKTQSRVRDGELFSRTATAFTGPMVLDQFYELHSQIQRHGDASMAQFNHVLAWFNTGLGRLFGGIVLTPEIDFQEAFDLLKQRWYKVGAERDVYEDTMDVPTLLQWKLDVFYGAEIAPDRLIFQPARQGQPRQWQKYWQWLGAEIEPTRALEAVRLAARLMICPPVLVFLKTMLNAGQDGAITIDRLLALMILRRLILQLRVMSWFEHAVQRSFLDLRVEDLASFAFSALRPHWPRRLLALSHRSKDVKSELMNLQLWGNFRFSIDAMFAPHWETNVGTIWGLFSAVPGLLRVRSQNYDDSVWCRREKEMFAYLCEDDFLPGRHVIELDKTDLSLLDWMIPPSPERSHWIVKAGQFPPFTSVFILFPFEAWECRMLACAAVTRFIFKMLGDAANTAAVCRLLAQGHIPPLPVLTNHPDGWAPIAQLLRAFQQEWSGDENVFPMTVDEGQYGQEDLERDIALMQNLIDLSDGVIDQAAAFAALEWNRTILPALIGNGRYGQFFAADYRWINQDLWRSDQFMVIRGVNRIHSAAPVWILQRADQRVDEWPGIGTNPIFTQHLEGQWNWMNELLDATQWPASYRKECKLVFSPELSAACAATKARDNSYYRGKWV